MTHVVVAAAVVRVCWPYDPGNKRVELVVNTARNPLLI